ncbi:tRNA lysidine(34) synthetase TilS [bacterium]|nr:tRNA lysidine(34) synthetase TilS [bacterium]
MLLLTFNTSLLQPNSTIIVGLSGGPDSVCLLHYLATHKDKLNIKIIAAHLNHEWRSNAHEDVEFCKQLCETLQIPFVTKKASELDFTPKDNGSKESMGRTLRRHFFKTVAQTYQATAVALGHHQQDQIETFFIRLIRGTTITGLGCMKERDGLYIRPLLKTSKTAILQYLKEHGLSSVYDATNDSHDFLRNRIRLRLAPVLTECDQRAEQQIINTIDTLQETESFLTDLTEETFKTVFDGKKLDLKKFFACNPYLQKRVLIVWLYHHKSLFTLSNSFLDEILRFLTKPNGATHQLSSTLIITKKKHQAELVTISSH